jgi:all-trans-retinol 13,14-reductase
VSNAEPTRRDIIQAAMAAMPFAGFDWDAFPQAKPAAPGGEEFDAVIIGSGLGGLSCAAAFARKGYRALVLEQHDKPGGYATAFRRPGGFTFDVSLHSTSVGERNGVRNLIGGFPEITEVEFLPHPSLYRAIFPEHDILVPQRDVPGYVDLLARQFPEEKAGIEGLIGDMEALSREIAKLSAAQGRVDMSRFPTEFPVLYRSSQQSWGQMVDARIRDPKLKAIVSALWGYYGLPPSRLSTFYYALPTIGYLRDGGYYPRGRSQTISDALVKFIEARGGKVALRTRVERILTKDGAAYGVRCAGGQEFRGRAIVSNASAWHTFNKFLEDGAALEQYKKQMAGFSVSLSCFQIFLGLKKDLVAQVGLKDSEIFVETGYDSDAGYEAARKADMSRCGFALTLYDNVFPGYSPKGKNTINLLALQGFDHWEPFEADYTAGRKTAYRAEKEKMANLLMQRAEKVLPGLTTAVEVKEIGTPLTNVRYTGNYRGAIYGWDQTVSNSGARRIGHSTPVKNLYLAGAWTRPGHGYGAVLSSGPECFAEIVRAWG